MAIELSNLTFTEQDDIVPESGVEQILNTGIANTFAGNDEITGTIGDYAFKNVGTLDTDSGNDKITGTSTGVGIGNFGTLIAGEGNDTITGNGYFGIENYGTLNTDDGKDIITATGVVYGLNNYGTLNTGQGNDIITSITTIPPYLYVPSLYNPGFIDTSDGDDIITSSSNTVGISNEGIINSGNGKDSIICQGEFINQGEVFLEDGNDLISVNHSTYNVIVANYNFIGTGDGDDTITSTGLIRNTGVIETGNGDDSIIVGLDIEGSIGVRMIQNYGGLIDMGDGNDSIIAYDGFESAPNSSGAWFLGEGEDYIKGYGSGDFYGGNGFDTLELTPGTYTVVIWDRVVFAKGNSLMLASEFEQLIAGDQTYDFTSLTHGQIINVS